MPRVRWVLVWVTVWHRLQIISNQLIVLKPLLSSSNRKVESKSVGGALFRYTKWRGWGVEVSWEGWGARGAERNREARGRDTRRERERERRVASERETRDERERARHVVEKESTRTRECDVAGCGASYIEVRGVRKPSDKLSLGTTVYIPSPCLRNECRQVGATNKREKNDRETERRKKKSKRRNKQNKQ